MSKVYRATTPEQRAAAMRECVLRNRARYAGRDNRIVALSREMRSPEIARAIGVGEATVRRVLARAGIRQADMRRKENRPAPHLDGLA